MNHQVVRLVPVVQDSSRQSRATFDPDHKNFGVGKHRTAFHRPLARNQSWLAPWGNHGNSGDSHKRDMKKRRFPHQTACEATEIKTAGHMTIMLPHLGCFPWIQFPSSMESMVRPRSEGLFGELASRPVHITFLKEKTKHLHDSSWFYPTSIRDSFLWQEWWNNIVKYMYLYDEISVLIVVSSPYTPWFQSCNAG